MHLAEQILNTMNQFEFSLIFLLIFEHIYLLFQAQTLKTYLAFLINFYHMIYRKCQSLPHGILESIIFSALS